MEEFDKILRNLRIGREQPQVSISTSGCRLIVSRSNVPITAQPFVFLSNDEYRFGVRFEAEQAVDYVYSSFLQLSRPVDISLFIEAGAQFYDTDNLFAC